MRSTRSPFANFEWDGFAVVNEQAEAAAVVVVVEVSVRTISVVRTID